MGDARSRDHADGSTGDCCGGDSLFMYRDVPAQYLSSAFSCSVLKSKTNVTLAVHHAGAILLFLKNFH